MRMLQRLSLTCALCGLAGVQAPLAHAVDLQDRAKSLSREFSVDAKASQPDAVKDPFEGLNRKIFVFNTRMDEWFLQPVARGYQRHLPDPLRKGVSNFFANLGEPWTAVNQLLQGEARDAGRSLGRFVVNTVTTLGLGDVAFAQLGQQRGKEDFGQTLAVWGMRSGPFLMLPFRGPSTVRDGIGFGVDQFGSYRYALQEDPAWSWGLFGTQVVSRRADLLGLESLVQGDQYALVRDVYLQNRVFQINQQTNQPDQQQTLPSIDDSFGDEMDSAAPVTPAESPAVESEALTAPAPAAEPDSAPPPVPAVAPETTAPSTP